MTSPIQIQRTTRYGLAQQNIFGFALFGYNKVDIPFLQEPISIFLEQVVAEFPCSAHVGTRPYGGWTTEQFFGKPGEARDYIPNRYGISSGVEFYDLDGEYYNKNDACFFPAITSPQLGLSEEDYEQCILEDALIVLVGRTEETLQRMPDLLKMPFPGHEEWMHTLASLYSIIIRTGGDGDFVSAYAQDETHFEKLEGAIAASRAVIESSEWYQHHREQLVWDGEYGMCLRLPE
jgi:hypothetical protein